MPSGNLFTRRRGTRWHFVSNKVASCGFDVGSVQTLEYILFGILKREQETAEFTLTSRQLHARCLAVLETFTSDKHWLAALAGEGSVFATDDPADEQLIRALERFTSGSIKLLSRDKPLLESHPDKAISPEDYIEQTLRNPKQPKLEFTTRFRSNIPTQSPRRRRDQATSNSQRMLHCLT